MRWIILALSIVAAAYASQMLKLGFSVKLHDFNDFLVLLIGVFILGFLNATLGRVLKLLTIPLNCLTFGLFSLVINAVVLWLAASLKLGYEIDESSLFGSFIAAFVASLMISFINGFLNTFLTDSDKKS